MLKNHLKGPHWKLAMDKIMYQVVWAAITTLMPGRVLLVSESALGSGRAEGARFRWCCFFFLTVALCSA